MGRKLTLEERFEVIRDRELRLVKKKVFKNKHCKQGHGYTKENTAFYFTRSSLRATRICKQCQKESSPSALKKAHPPKVELSCNHTLPFSKKYQEYFYFLPKEGAVDIYCKICGILLKTIDQF